jgi:ribosome-associated protein
VKMNSPEISKSQIKRDLQELRTLAERLLGLSIERINALSNKKLGNALLEGKRITKGNARKRQIQYIAKLIRHCEPEEIQTYQAWFDPDAEKIKFLKLERWRDRLMNDQAHALDEIFTTYPNVDRQQLRLLVRQAITERQREDDDNVTNYRKLFQFLRGLPNT